MVKGTAILLFVAGLLFVPVGIGEIYRWVDDQGNVHYGDCPPADCGAVPIRSHTRPSQKAVNEAQETARRLQDYQRQLSQDRKRDATETKPPVTPGPSIDVPADIPCFAVLAESWGERIPDARGNIHRRPLEKAEHGWLKGLLRSMEGRRDGVIRETVCVRPDASPPSKVWNYDVDWHGEWRSDRVFRVRAEQRGLETRSVDVSFYSYLLSDDGLRFRKTGTDTYSQLDKPGNDAEVVELTDRGLTFFWRRDSNVRRTNVISLRSAGRRVEVSEFFYVQGMLTGKRHWTINR